MYTDSSVWAVKENLIFLNSLSPAEKQWLQAHPVIRAAGPLVFPPFQFIDKKGQTKGMAVDFMHLAADLLGVRIELHENLDWQTILNKIQLKEIDMLTCATRTPSREKYLNYSDPYLSFPLVIITQKESPFVGSIEDLSSKTVSFTKGVSTYEWLQRDRIKTVPYFVNTFKEALEAVSTGKADAYIGNLAAVTYYIEKFGMTNLKIAAPTPYGNYNLHMAARKDWPELASLLNKALNHITQEQRSQIRNRWLAVRYEYGIRLSDILIWIASIVLVSSIVTGIVVIWNRRLQKEIQERLRAETALRESEERFKAVFNSAKDAIFIKNNDLQYSLVNPAMERLYAVPAARFFGKKDEVLFDQNTLQHTEETEKYVLKGNTVVEEQIIPSASGSASTLHIIKVPLYSGSNQISGICGIIRDITGIKEMEARVRQAEKMDAIGTLAGGVAHDFNNLLSIILGYAELALEDAPALQPLPRFLNQIKNAANRGRDIVRQLLHFGDRTEIQTQPLHLKPLLQNTLHMLRFSLPSNVEMNERIADDLKLVSGDSNKIHQMVFNLGQNAFHAMQDNGGTLTVSLENAGMHGTPHFRDLPPSENGYVKLTVADTGRGIAPESKKRIFEPYFTSRNFGEARGLGLAVVHGIVSQMNGAVFVESNVDEGTAVRILLPALSLKTAEAAVQLKDSAEKASHILLVDNEIDILDITEQILDRHGYRVKSLSDPLLAVEFFSNNMELFDLIITDMALPQKEGEHFIRQILDIRSDIPIIACSRQIREIAPDISQLPGVCRYMEKPLERHELLQAVQQVLEGECA